MMEALHLFKRYIQGRWYSRNRFQVTALDDVSLTVPPCSTLALVGESGAGKSTLGRCLARLEEPDGGEIRFEGRSLSTLEFADRRSIQFIFQDSATAMNPSFSVVQVVEEPLRIQAGLDRREQRKQALAMMEQVGISSQWAERSALELSGGQRQKLAIARALILKPRFLILDEALSSLDLPVQAQITKLLLDLQAAYSLTYLFITHDLRLAAQVADRMAVMQCGRIVESGSVSSLFLAPQHSYTRSLLAAIPNLHPQVSTPRSATGSD